MSDVPAGSTARVYQDQEGNDVTLRQLIKLEPEWAHSRITHCEKLELVIQMCFNDACSTSGKVSKATALELMNYADTRA